MPASSENPYPWITFEVDLRSASHELWMLLGEAASKCEHLAGVPLRPDVAQRLHRVFLAKGVMATTAIEGNTLSAAEVEAHLEGKLSLPPSKAYLAQEVQNIVDAINGTVLGSLHAPISVELICELNRMVLRDLALNDEDTVPGRVRAHRLTVGRYHPPVGSDCPALLSRMVNWLQEMEHHAPPDADRAFAVLRAIIAHLYLVWIHPFGDGNGRTSRLLEVFILLRAGVPTPAAHLLSNFYNETRAEYYRQLDKASRTGSPMDFILYALRGFVDQLREQIAVVRAEQIRVAWVNHVYSSFAGETSPSKDRQVHLVLAMSEADRSLGRAEIVLLTTRLAANYGQAASKMLTRDLNVLVSLGLVRREAGARYRANRELILAFLPFSMPRGAGAG